MNVFNPLADEDARQRAVDRSGVLRRPRDERLQRIVERAARVSGAPIAAISVIDHDRQWLAARTGVDLDQTPREYSFCAHAIHRPGEPLVVFDATEDPRFCHNPLVTAAPHIRFYAGVPLIDRAGYALGALCVADPAARTALPDMVELKLLANEAERLVAR